MTVTLQEAAHSAMALATKLFDEEGFLGPLWFINVGDRLAIVKGQFDGNDSKNAALALIRQKFGQDATRIIFVSECWMSSQQGSWNGTPPSECPDREEIIHLIAEDREGAQLVLTRKIERNKQGKPTLLPTETHDYKEIGGRFASFFDRSATTKH